MKKNLLVLGALLLVVPLVGCSNETSNNTTGSLVDTTSTSTTSTEDSTSSETLMTSWTASEKSDMVDVLGEVLPVISFVEGYFFDAYSYYDDGVIDTIYVEDYTLTERTETIKSEFFAGGFSVYSTIAAEAPYSTGYVVTKVLDDDSAIYIDFAWSVAHEADGESYEAGHYFSAYIGELE